MSRPELMSETIRTVDNAGENTLDAFKRHRFSVLDGMRGIAAVLIVFNHYFSDFKETFPNVYIVVDFFFILSGFVICHAYGERLLAGMRAKHYLALRVARLFPMMAIGLSIGTIVLLAAAHFGRTEFSLFDIGMSTITNLLFLPYINHKKVFLTSEYSAGLIFPADGPLWSIFFEMVASIAFLWLIRFRTKFLVAICFCSYMLIGIGAIYNGHIYHMVPDTNGGFKSSNFLIGFPRVIYGFVFGIILYRIRLASPISLTLNAPQGGFLTFAKSGVLYIILLATLLFPFELNGVFYFLTIAVIAPWLVFYGSKTTFRSGITFFIFDRLGWLSYPIYCLHGPLSRLVKGVNDHFALNIPISWISLIITFLGALIITIFIDKFVQKRFTKFLTRPFIFNRII